jgi:hypothetical protein
MITHLDGEEVHEMTYKVNQAIRIREAMFDMLKDKEKRQNNSKEWQEEYRELDFRFEELIGGMNREEQAEMFQKLIKKANQEGEA